jgi:hypothetical protein
MKSVYARYALWHGYVDNWPPLSLVVDPRSTVWDKTTGSTISKIRTVIEHINAKVGVAVGDRASEAQLLAAYKFCTDSAVNPETNSFTSFYNYVSGLSQAAGMAGIKRPRGAAEN